MNTQEILQEIVEDTGKHFRTFGGGRVTPNNPISIALKDGPLEFSAGVDVKEVVMAVLLLAHKKDLLSVRGGFLTSAIIEELRPC